MKASFGSICSGTLRPEDLIPALADELRSLRGALPKSIHQGIREWQSGNDLDLADDLIDELSNALQEYAPPYGYFGAHEGDGADFGYWLSDDALTEFDGLKVSDTSEVPADYTGEVLHVNDHGNVTLYVSRKGNLREVWAIV